MKAETQTIQLDTISPEILQKMNAYWRAANYLSVGQIYLYDNALLKKPLTLEHIKPRLLGHWGTTPGLNFIYVHLNRIIKQYDLNIIYVTGPGHGGPGLVANTYLEGTYTELYPEITKDENGLKKLFKQFSFPGGIPSHVAPETPGSINEGGELGYSLVHAYGAVFDNPDLIVACVIGDGEAETGPLAASWHSNKFLNPVHDGAVLPILHLNGYKIAGPTVLARIPKEELEHLLIGYGYKPFFVAGDVPEEVHQLMATTLDHIVTEIKQIQNDARRNGFTARPQWPMIVLQTPKGWTGPKEVDSLAVEGTWRSHQVPLAELATKPEHVKQLEDWMKSYKPEELFDEDGKLISLLAELAPQGKRRMGANPNANGGLLLHNLRMPDFRIHAVAVTKPGTSSAEATRVMGAFLRDVMQLNWDRRNFRIFGPDETASNRLTHLFEITGRTSTAEIIPGDDHISPDGRVTEVLSEHLCQGWLEGYLLTGRHGLFSCYEAFIHIVDSMFNQHAKWLKVANKIPWRSPIASLNYLLTSHVWRQDHNGNSHQDPGFLDLVANKSADIIRIYLPPDANTLLSVTDHCLRSRNYINVIVAGKQPELQYLDMDAAVKHCTAGIGIWEWASNDEGGEPDVVMACAGDVPTLETLAAVQILREHFRELKVRVVNVVDLMTLQSQSMHPHGLSDADFDALFTKDKPIIFAFHGYPLLVHRLTYRRTNHDNLHVHGYKGEGTTTTPFDMVVMNDLDRFHLVIDVIDRVSELQTRGSHTKQHLQNKLLDHKAYIEIHGEDMPEIRNWKWNLNLSTTNGTMSNPEKETKQIKILAFDVGGSKIKATVLDQEGIILQDYKKVETPKHATPESVLEAIKTLVKDFQDYDKISVGFPGYVKKGIVYTAPNLGTDLWKGTNLNRLIYDALNKPVRIVNDADMQGLAVVSGVGLEMVITLGTGFGTALLQDGNLLPHIELAHHKVTKNKTYDEYVGDDALESKGKEKWNKRMKKILAMLKVVFNYDRLYIGGGNAEKLNFKLEENIVIVSNIDGIKGGSKLWQLDENLFMKSGQL